MKVDVTSINSFKKQLTFQVPATTVKQRLDAEFKRLAKRARIRGFRQGKAPRRVLEARFGEQVRSDLANSLIQQGYSDAISNHALEPVGRPSVTRTGDISETGFDFTISVDVRPEISLDTYKQLEVAYPEVKVEDSEIDIMVDRKLASKAKLEEVSGRPVEMGDVVLVELAIKDGDDEVHSEPGTMIRTEGDPWFTGLEAHLIGLESGVEATFDTTFTDDTKTEAVAGKTLSVTCTVHSIQRNQTPTLSDDVAEEMGYEGGADGMRTALEGELRENRDAMARNQARANLLEALIKANSFDVPASMIESSLQMLMEELKLQQAYATGRNPRTISFNEAQMNDLRVRAEFAAKAGLILEHVAKTETITVTDSDIEAKYQELADMRGQNLEAVRGYFQQPEQMAELKDRLLEEKTLDWLLEQSNLVIQAPKAPENPELAALAEAAVSKQVKEKRKAKAKADKKEAKAGKKEAKADKKEAKADKKAAKADKKAAKAEKKAATDAGVDLSVLKLAIGKLKTAIATGDYDSSLSALLDAEQSGKNRKGAVAALEARLAEIG